MSKWSFIKYRYLRIGAAVFVVLLTIGTFVWFQGRGPWYRGHSLQYWVQQTVWYQPKKVQKEGREALRAMGQPAVTRLIQIVQSEDKSWRRSLWEWQMTQMAGGKKAMIPLTLYMHLLKPPGVAQGEAVRALGEIGQAASNGIPVLRRTSNDRMSGCSAAAKAALIKIRIGTKEGQRELADLLVDLDNTNSMSWWQTAYVVSDLGTNARPAIPLLCKMLESSTMPQNLAAVHTISSLRIEARQCVPALIHCIERGEFGDTMMALGVFGESARPAIPALRKHLSSSDSSLRRSIEAALERIMGKKEFAELVKLQEQAARDSDAAARERAVKALEQIGSKAKAAPMVEEAE